MTGIETILAIASTAVQVIGSINSAAAEKSAADYNAAIARRNQLIALQQGQAEEARQRRAAAKRMGAMRAAYGASGVTPEGTPLDVLEESAAEAELDAQTVRYNAQLRAMGYGDTAALEEMRGRNAMREGYTKAGSALLLGGMDLYNRSSSGLTRTG